MSYSLNWDLETFYKGGSHSLELQERLEKLQNQVKVYQASAENWISTARASTEAFQKLVTQKQELIDGFTQVFAFVTALQSQNSKDSYANTLAGNIQVMYTSFQNADTIFSKKIATVDEITWLKLVNNDAMSPIQFNLNEIREEAKKLLSTNEENIINQLAVDGFHGWSSHYDTIVNSIHIEYASESLSAGQAVNKMMGDPDANVRAEIFKRWESTWSEKAPLFADTLNHLDGFRLTNQQLHHIDNYLEEPLRDSRLQLETLETMWATIDKNIQPFIDFLQRKAQLFGKEKLDWQDQDAPIILGDLADKTFSFDEAAAFITKNFEAFSPKMSQFATFAFENQWIEAENRPNKRPGGYCEDFPESQESRIFLTYSGSINEVATIAHELGHAFHSQVMRDLPALSRGYAMNVAETASTLAELIVADATLKTASTKAEKINLLDIKLQNAIAMFCNIHARFIFENNFYQQRKEQTLTAEEISELMLAAQKEAYHNALGSYHPHFWASKLHFYIDDVAFYNFPYTFGYLFSLGIYAFAKESGKNFEDDYIALLRDTAAMTTEELAQKHLGVDLTQPEFWQKGIDIVKKDIEEFMELSADFI